MSNRADLLIVVGIIGLIGILAWVANEIPQTGGPITGITDDLKSTSTCDGECGDGYWRFLFVPLAILCIVGLVGLIIGTIGQRSKK